MGLVTVARGRELSATAYVSLGANVGDALGTLTAAVFALDETDGIAVADTSGIYRTEPWGGVEQDDFLNACVRVVTSLDPHALLAELQAIETAFGRDRDAEVRFGPRPLDLDLLLYDGEVVDTPDLTIPHPRMHERAFVLVPLSEIMPGGALPDGRRLSRLLAELAPIEGIELILREDELPSTRVPRPEGPGAPSAYLAGERPRPGRPGPEVER